MEMWYDWVKCRHWGKGMSSQSVSKAGRYSRQALEYLTVRGFYTSAYAEIVQPERIFAVTDYFRRYWVPLLKPGPAWLIVALRQRCYWNQQRDWCVASRETLAAECGVTARTVDNYLTLPLVDQFLVQKQRRYRRTADGQKQRDWTRYFLRLDDPLTPLHQAALAALVARVLRECQPLPDASLRERALSVAQYLLELGVEGLWERMRSCEQTLAVQQAAQAIPHPRTLQEILEDACQLSGSSQRNKEVPHQAEETQLALSRACDALYNRIVRPDKVQIATQYFRLSWLPLLGAARAWLILDLRSRCYLNYQEMELRDTCTVNGYSELANRLGVSVSTVKTCISQPPGPIFLRKLATRRPGRGLIEIDFQVEMIDRLTPDDELRYREMATANRKSEFSESLAGQESDSSGSFASQETGFSPTPAAQETESSDNPEQKPKSAVRLANQEPESAAIGQHTKRQDLQDTIIPYSTWPVQKGQQQHKVLIRIPADQSLPLAAAVSSLVDTLDDLEIADPARERIVSLAPPISHVLAWLLEAFSHEHIQNKIGFVIAMLLSRYPPPPATERLVMLPISQWAELYVAARQVRKTGQTQIPASLVGVMEEVLERLGHMPPEEWPFVLPMSAWASLADSNLQTEAVQANQQSSDELQEAQELWSTSLKDLQLQMPQATFDTWLRDSQVVAVNDDMYVVQVRSFYAVDWLQKRLSKPIHRTLSRLVGHEVGVRFECGAQ
jgi:hypothetical protein